VVHVLCELLTGLNVKGRPPDMEGSWEYIKQSESRKRVVFQLGGWGGVLEMKESKQPANITSYCASKRARNVMH